MKNYYYYLGMNLEDQSYSVSPSEIQDALDRREWVLESRRERRVSQRVKEFYEEAPFYSVEINGSEMILPVLTDEHWLRRSNYMDSLLGKFKGGYNSVHRSKDITKTAIDQYAMAKGDIQDTHKFKIGEYVWNGPIYNLVNIDVKPLSFDFELTDYFTYISTSHRLVREMHNSIRYNAPLDFRKSTLSTFDDFTRLVSYPFKVGIDGVVILPRGDGKPGWEVYIVKRSSRNVEAPSMYSTVPNGTFAPMDVNRTEKDFSLVNLFCQEFIEEIFNQQVSEDVTKTELFSRYESGSIDIWGNGFVADALSGKFSIGVTAIVRDEDTAEWIRSNEDMNWETDESYTVKFPREDKPQEMRVGVSNPLGLSAFYEALLLAEEEYDAKTGFDLSRTISKH